MNIYKTLPFVRVNHIPSHRHFSGPEFDQIFTLVPGWGVTEETHFISWYFIASVKYCRIQLHTNVCFSLRLIENLQFTVSESRIRCTTGWFPHNHLLTTNIPWEPPSQSTYINCWENQRFFILKLPFLNASLSYETVLLVNEDFQLTFRIPYVGLLKILWPSQNIWTLTKFLMEGIGVWKKICTFLM